MMTTISTSFVLFASLLGPGQSAVSAQQTANVEDLKRDVIEKFQAIRPDEKDLAVYGLDWAPTLKEAKARATKEHRPIFLIVVTNSFGNIFTGHC